MLKKIKDFDGYFVSEEGKIYCNLGKGCRDRKKTVGLYEIKPRVARNGYLRVYMRQISTDTRKDKYIHRLVAEYFLPKIEGMNIVNHKDTDRKNNIVSNLEWTNHKGNNAYSMKLGHLKRNSLGQFYS